MASTLPFRSSTMVPLQSALVSLEAALSIASGSTSRSSTTLGRQWLRHGFPGLQQARAGQPTHLNPRTSSIGSLLLNSQTKPDDAVLRPAYMQSLFRRNSRPQTPSIRYFSSSRAAYLSQPSPSTTQSTTSPSSASSSSSSSADAEADADTSLKGKFKTLMRRYGWATVVVYVLFSAIDFGIAFFAINLVGAEHVRRGQDYVLDTLVYGTAHNRMNVDEGAPRGNGVLGFLKEWRENQKLKEKEHERESKKGGAGGAWATAVLAYTIHKTLFLPLRLGATAAATPAIVKQLQRWGVNIAKNPIPESVKQRGAKSIKSGKDRLDRARGKHGDWL